MKTVTPIVRRAGLDLDLRDLPGPRAWIQEHVRQGVMLGEPADPTAILIGDGFVDTFDLNDTARTDPGAHPGATFRALRARPGVLRCFLLLRLGHPDPAAGQPQLALVLEELDGPRWWFATLPYDTDPGPDSGSRRPGGSPPPRPPSSRTCRPSSSSPRLRLQVRVLPACRGRRHPGGPSCGTSFGELGPDEHVPADAREMIEFAVRLGVVQGLLSGQPGSRIVRISERAWEEWVVDGVFGPDLDEHIRWIGNHRLPVADGVVLAQVVLHDRVDPPAPGILLVGEHSGAYVESFGPLVYPHGPGGRVVVAGVQWFKPKPVEPGGRWIGVPSKIDLSQGLPEA